MPYRRHYHYHLNWNSNLKHFIRQVTFFIPIPFPFLSPRFLSSCRSLCPKTFPLFPSEDWSLYLLFIFYIFILSFLAPLLFIRLLQILLHSIENDWTGMMYIYLIYIMSYQYFNIIAFSEIIPVSILCSFNQLRLLPYSIKAGLHLRISTSFLFMQKVPVRPAIHPRAYSEQLIKSFNRVYGYTECKRGHKERVFLSFRNEICIVRQNHIIFCSSFISNRSNGWAGRQATGMARGRE